MAITLQHLCKYARERYDMYQLVGEEGMDNLVDWVHMLEDPETAYFLHGQELIFTTGIAPHDDDWYITFAEGLVKNKASGWVINIGPYIKEVPRVLIDFCKEHKLPLFTIPWQTRIVDVTNDFCHRIIKAEEIEVSVGGAFRNAIFNPNNVTLYRQVLERKGFNMEGQYGVIAIILHGKSDDSLHDFEKSVRMHLSKILLSRNEKFSVFGQDQQLLVVMQDFTEEDVEETMERLLSVANFGGKKYHFHAGFGGFAKGIEKIGRSYKRAIDVQKMAINQKSRFLGYHQIGVHQLLLEVDNKEVLQDYYDKTIGVLEDYDEKHDSNYCYILKCYLDSNNSVEKVAQHMYVHRNTINYKIKKIKEILNTDFSYEDGIKMMLAYHIKSML